MDGSPSPRFGVLSTRLSIRTGGISSTTSGDTLLFIFFPFPSIYFVRVKIRCKEGFLRRVARSGQHGHVWSKHPKGDALSFFRASEPPQASLRSRLAFLVGPNFGAESKKDCRPRRLALTPRVFPCQAPNASALRCARLAETFPSLLLSPELY